MTLPSWRPVRLTVVTPAELSQTLLDLVTTLAERRRRAIENSAGNSAENGAEIRTDGTVGTVVAAPVLNLTLADVTLDRPKNRDHGDWASSISMKIAKPLGSNPREIAAELAEGLLQVDGVASVEVAGPGFINIRLDAAAAGALARTIVETGEAYGTGHLYDGVRINLEFVSANPTGPIHMGGVRWAAVGDSLARVLKAEGADVTREYYFNDHGSQIDRFARSVLAAYLGEPTPDDGYGGAYISDIADQVVALYDGDIAALPRDEQQEVFRSIGVDLMFKEIKAKLHGFGVDFDVFFHEDSLHESGAVERAIERLREQGHIFETDGAIWLRTTTFGDDRDRVIIRSNGEPAYISGDIGYYLDKRERGFDQNLIMLGADHHGYVGRLMAMVAAFGDEPGVNLQILIGQMVNLLRDGEPVRMSKRNGTIVTLDDLVDAVGVDAGRYALVRSSSDSQLDIDLDLLGKRTNENPVFYVQYAHARTRSVARNAAASGVDRSAFAPELLTHDSESALLGVLQEYPRVVAQAAELREPHRIARYIEEVAGYYHRWYDNCRVIPLGDEPVSDLHRTRLWLNDATGQVIRNGLGLLGVTAPERM
jgi:arginyl-tRNA synthetase